MVLEWEQATRLLYAAGDVRHIRVWDTDKEISIQDIPTRADSCVSCLTSDSADRSLLVAGCGDGTVRLYDRRMPPSSRYPVGNTPFLLVDIFLIQSCSNPARTQELDNQCVYANI